MWRSVGATGQMHLQRASTLAASIGCPPRHIRAWRSDACVGLSFAATTLVPSANQRPGVSTFFFSDFFSALELDTVDLARRRAPTPRVCRASWELQPDSHGCQSTKFFSRKFKYLDLNPETAEHNGKRLSVVRGLLGYVESLCNLNRHCAGFSCFSPQVLYVLC